MAEAPRILLEHHLKRLKLPTFLREYEKVARQCAAEGLDHVQFLARLVEMEIVVEFIAVDAWQMMAHDEALGERFVHGQRTIPERN